MNIDIQSWTGRSNVVNMDIQSETCISKDFYKDIYSWA